MQQRVKKGFSEALPCGFQMNEHEGLLVIGRSDGRDETSLPVEVVAAMGLDRAVELHPEPWEIFRDLVSRVVARHYGFDLRSKGATLSDQTIWEKLLTEVLMASGVAGELVVHARRLDAMHELRRRVADDVGERVTRQWLLNELDKVLALQ
jgi:hypothetical protein